MKPRMLTVAWAAVMAGSLLLAPNSAATAAMTPGAPPMVADSDFTIEIRETLDGPVVESYFISLQDGNGERKLTKRGRDGKVQDVRTVAPSDEAPELEVTATGEMRGRGISTRNEAGDQAADKAADRASRSGRSSYQRMESGSYTGGTAAGTRYLTTSVRARSTLGFTLFRFNTEVHYTWSGGIPGVQWGRVWNIRCCLAWDAHPDTYQYVHDMDAFAYDRGVVWGLPQYYYNWAGRGTFAGFHTSKAQDVQLCGPYKLGCYASIRPWSNVDVHQDGSFAWSGDDGQ